MKILLENIRPCQDLNRRPPEWQAVMETILQCYLPDSKFGFEIDPRFKIEAEILSAQALLKSSSLWAW